MEAPQIVKDHFSVFVVLSVFLCLYAAYLVLVIWHPGATGTVDWLEGEMKEVVGAVLMGLTAAVKAGVNGSSPNPSNQPNQDPPKQ